MKNILLVVDMQKGFTRYEQAVDLTERIRQLLSDEVFDTVIATRFINAKNSVYEKLFGWYSLETEEEQSLVQGYNEYVDYTVDKSIYTCVNANFIQLLCQCNDGNYPEKVFVVGVDTDCCVLAIATSLFEYNIRPIVLTQYCDSTGGPESHQAGLLCMKRLIGPNQLVDKMIKTKEDLLTI